MELVRATIESLNKNRKWIFVGVILYIIPVIYRFATKNSFVPLLDNTLFIYHSNSQLMPVNLEILGILFLIPGAIGAIVGANFLEIIFNRRFTGLEKFLARVLGSITFGLGWTVVQFVGFSFFNPVGPWGNTLWAGPDAYARNLLVALVVAPLVPYLIEFIYKRIKK